MSATSQINNNLPGINSETSPKMIHTLQEGHMLHLDLRPSAAFLSFLSAFSSFKLSFSSMSAHHNMSASIAMLGTL